MAKYGIGVGEEFPVDEPKNPPPPEDDDERRKMRRRWRRFYFLHVLTRIALIALVISGIAQSDSAVHSPNERLVVDNYYRGIDAVIRFIYGMAKG